MTKLWRCFIGLPYCFPLWKVQLQHAFFLMRIVSECFQSIQEAVAVAVLREALENRCFTPRLPTAVLAKLAKEEETKAERCNWSNCSYANTTFSNSCSEYNAQASILYPLQMIAFIYPFQHWSQGIWVVLAKVAETDQVAIKVLTWMRLGCMISGSKRYSYSVMRRLF